MLCTMPLPHQHSASPGPHRLTWQQHFMVAPLDDPNRQRRLPSLTSNSSAGKRGSVTGMELSKRSVQACNKANVGVLQAWNKANVGVFRHGTKQMWECSGRDKANVGPSGWRASPVRVQPGRLAVQALPDLHYRRPRGFQAPRRWEQLLNLDAPSQCFRQVVAHAAQHVPAAFRPSGHKTPRNPKPRPRVPAPARTSPPAAHLNPKPKTMPAAHLNPKP
jgi:hypothetical protein